MKKTGRLTKAEDILEAAEWCLAGVPPSDVAFTASLLRQYANDFTEDRPEVADILKYLRYQNNRKSSWTLACAILARDAWDINDAATFWSSGIEVLKAMQQGIRGGHHNRKIYTPDALDTCIAEYLTDFPIAKSNHIFESFSEMANSFHDVIVELDQDRDELVCQLNPDNEKLTNVGRDEFSRRVKRATGCM